MAEEQFLAYKGQDFQIKEKLKMQIGVVWYMDINKQYPAQERFDVILQAHIKKYGLPTEILLSDKNSDKLTTNGLKLVVGSVHLPLNHVWFEIINPKGEQNE